MKTLDFSSRMTGADQEEFAQYIRQLSRRVGFKMSARGWCYLLESERIINKDSFDKVNNWIVKAIKNGLLPVNFVAEDPSREFRNVSYPSEETPLEYYASFLEVAQRCGNYYDVDWFADEEYYIQVIVEKIDLRTLFDPICQQFHIPIANARGWPSVLSRAEYCRRFKEADERGLKCVLLYCGDHDPDGLRISDTLRKNLHDIRNIYWSDGQTGYDPRDLIIERFGLNYSFIQEHNLTMIDNLITGSGKNLASPSHPNHYLDYVQDYIDEFGVRKCEANAVVVIPTAARLLALDAILKYLGSDAADRFKAKRQGVIDEINGFQDEMGINHLIEDTIKEARERSNSV